MDFIESGKLATDAVKFFVLDEADRLLDSGSQDLVMKLFSKLPKAATGTQRLQVCTTPPPPPAALAPCSTPVLPPALLLFGCNFASKLQGFPAQ